MAFRSAVEPMVLPRDVRRALRAMRVNPARNLTVADLARIAGVSPRTLQRHFKEYLGKSPLAAFRDMKFENVRRAMLRETPGATVTEIAYRSGIRHLGRFSAEYARRFDELPSRTLRRRHEFPLATCQKLSFPASIGERPTVAVLPIETNERYKEIARGLVDEFASALSQRGFMVIERTIKARYHLRGTLQAEGHKLHLRCRLIDARTSSHIWAHHHDEMGEKDFAFGEEVAERVAAALQPVLLAAEIHRAHRKADVDVTAYDLTLRAIRHSFALSKDGSSRALDLLEQALASDPNYDLAIALASWCHAQRAAYPFSTAVAHDRAQALNLARRIENSHCDATVLAVLGNTHALLGDLNAADMVTQKALAICGRSSWAWARSGLIQVCNARPDEGIERLTIALDLASDDPVKLNCFMGLGAAHLEAGRFVHAAHWFERAVLEYPTSIWPHEFLGPAHVHSGRKDDALKSIGALQQAFPDLTISRVTEGISFFTQQLRDRVANGLDTVRMRV